MNSVIFFQELDVLKAHLVYRSSTTASHTRHPQESTICAPKTPIGRARKIQKQQVIVPLGVYEILLVLKANGKVQLSLGMARLNKALIRPIHRGPTLKYNPSMLVHIKYLTLINASLGYHNLK